MQTITIVLETKKIDEKTLEAILRRFLRELEKEGLRKAVQKTEVTIEE